jgi:hypothetical protein
MTLILTQLSDAGIAMAADSKIGFLVGGKLSSKVTNWKKLLKVPRLKAAISYWGSPGLIVPSPARFDEWLEKKIETGDYADLRSFADYLANEMNKAVGGKPLSNDPWGTGIHVTGFGKWPDDERRPIFYHIHNGHGHVEFVPEVVTINGQSITKTTEKPVVSPRQLFRRYNDFAPESTNRAELLPILTKGYTTINGDYVRGGGRRCVSRR